MDSVSRIERLANSTDIARDWADIEAILLMSVPLERQALVTNKPAFIAHWTDYYRYNQAELIYVARTAEGLLAGYLMGCADSRAAATSLAHHAGFALFADLHSAYPAHLHINCRPEYRTQGIGGRLIQALRKDLRDRSIGGVHVVTAMGARNVQFYRRNGFRQIDERVEQDRRLLFLGQHL